MASTRTNDEFSIIAIGASAGGYPAIIEILRNFNEPVPAAILIVVHGAFKAGKALASKLKEQTGFRVLQAEDGLPVMAGNVYLSVPDTHLIVRNGHLVLAAGPRENLFRPAIDVLFRSAAVNYGNRCIGVLLSGRLNDGTAGLEAIQRCGGTLIVQDPSNAAYPDMPQYALSVVQPDFVAELEDIPDILRNLVTSQLPAFRDIPQYLERENQLAWQLGSQVETEEYLGDQVPKSCPSCGGPLWEINEEESGFPRYRCHVGHAFSREALLAGQDDSLEQAMWMSLRTLEEKQNLLERMKKDYTKRGLKGLVRSYDDKLKEVKTNINSIRKIMEINEE